MARDLCSCQSEASQRTDGRLADLVLRPGGSLPDQTRKPLVLVPVITIVVREPGPGQISAWRDETIDRPPGNLVPAYIERGEFGKNCNSL